MTPFRVWKTIRQIYAEWSLGQLAFKKKYFNFNYKETQNVTAIPS